MKLALAALLLFSSVPAAQAYESQGGYAREQKCFKKVYKETLRSWNYEKSWIRQDRKETSSSSM